MPLRPALGGTASGWAHSATQGSQVVEQAVSGSCEERIPLGAREREDRFGGNRTAYHNRLALHGNLNACPALAVPSVPHRLFPCRSFSHCDPSCGFGISHLVEINMAFPPLSNASEYG